MPCTDADYAFLRSIVLEEASITLEVSRDYLFESRLHRLLDATGLGTVECLVAALRQKPDPVVRRSIAEAMTVNETSFFRDRSPFELMQLELLPALIRQRASCRSLRFWSAACSTGQEAYSLAMMICEKFPQLREWSVEILGTDISADVVGRARAGRYQRIEVNRGLPARYLLKYLQRTEDEWEIRPELKRLCRFRRHNLCRAPQTPEKYDGILLRNVLLYFSADTRREVLLKIHRVLQPDGFLMLGASEQADLPSHFQPALAHNSCYYRPIAQSPH